VARALRDGGRLAAAALTAGKLWVEVGTVDQATVALLKEADALVDADQFATRAWLSAWLAMELCHGGPPERSVERSAKAVGLARRSGDGAALAYALLAKRFSLVRPEQVRERLACIDESIMLAIEAAEPELALRGRVLRLVDLLQLGKAGAAAAETARFTAAATELRQPFMLNCSTVVGGLHALMQGRFVEAEKRIERVFAGAARSQRETTMQGAWLQLFFLRREQGRLRELAAQVRGLTAEYGERLGGWHAVLALLYLDMDLPDQAQAELELMMPGDTLAVPLDQLWLSTVALAAEVAAWLGDRGRCELLYQALVPYHDQVCVIAVTTPVVCFGSLSRHLGLLAGALDRWTDADRHFAHASQVNEALGGRPLLARMWHDWARTLVLRSADRDRGRAAVLLSRSVAAATELGMASLAEQASRLRDVVVGMPRGARV